MKLHANARTCTKSRRLLVDRITEQGWSASVAALRPPESASELPASGLRAGALRAQKVSVIAPRRRSAARAAPHKPRSR
jgi:hypothetical protein